MATRTRTRKQTAKTTTPTTPTAKPAAENRGTRVDLRHALPVRRRLFVGPHKPAELASIRAALAAAAARLPVPVRAWNGPTAHLTDGTTLRHTPTAATTDQTPTFLARVPCPHGAVHQHVIHTATELANARADASTCDTPHAPASTPKPSAVMHLRDGIRLAQDTQPLSLGEIADGLAARADQDTPKEHPQ